MLSLGLSLDIETDTDKVSVFVSILRLRKVKSRSQQRDWQSAYTSLSLETPTLVSLIPELLAAVQSPASNLTKIYNPKFIKGNLPPNFLWGPSKIDRGS
jgi:hypothetical protein